MGDINTAVTAGNIEELGQCLVNKDYTYETLYAALAEAIDNNKIEIVKAIIDDVDAIEEILTGGRRTALASFFMRAYDTGRKVEDGDRKCARVFYDNKAVWAALQDQISFSSLGDFMRGLEDSVNSSKPVERGPKSR